MLARSHGCLTLHSYGGCECIGEDPGPNFTARLDQWQVAATTVCKRAPTIRPQIQLSPSIGFCRHEGVNVKALLTFGGQHQGVVNLPGCPVPDQDASPSKAQEEGGMCKV